MKHYKIIFTLALMLLCIMPMRSAISGQWIQHPTFDNGIQKVIDTPSRTYFLCLAQSVNRITTAKSTPHLSLFYYDKEGDEIQAALRTASLSGFNIKEIAYNIAKNYLVILYDNYDIDLLYDNGTVANVPALRYADIPGSKNVNNITFDLVRNGIWLATDFGYVIINDEKFEVEDSRNYGVALNAAARAGDNVYIATPSRTYFAPASERRASLADYELLPEYAGISWMNVISADRAVFAIPREGQLNNDVYYVKASPEGFDLIDEHQFSGPMFTWPAKNGMMLSIWGTVAYYDVNRDYLASKIRPDKGGPYNPIASWDYSEFFTVAPRLGIKSDKSDGDNYVLTRDWMLPNAPNAYWSRGMAYHPKYGMLVNSHGVERVFVGDHLNEFNEPILLSGLKSGLWTPLSPAYRNPEQTATGYGPLGLVVDPADNKYVWSGSNFSGITRLNLDNPEDILHYSMAADPTSSLPGYVETTPVFTWARSCQFSGPAFDDNNTLWTFFMNYDNRESELEVRYLTEADRKASVNAASARPWRKLVIPGVESEMHNIFAPLKASANRGLLLYMTQNCILVYDTNRTPDNTSDDRRTVISPTFFDQDGGQVELYGANCYYEDPATGYVWFGTGSGVYYLQPQSILKGQTNVNRIKVARQDGTSLADYLLNGIGVNRIVADPQGRKWFATAGAGIVVTSADGREVHDEINMANSHLPSDYIYDLCYNPESRSFIISTDKGITEFSLNGATAAEDKHESVRAFPNPVHPDYYGWVTIDGLPDDAFVKIVDGSGNLVRELGRAEAGSIQWDVLNLHYKRVQTGVYYVLSSPASGSGESNVAKILVMN